MATDFRWWLPLVALCNCAMSPLPITWRWLAQLYSLLPSGLPTLILLVSVMEDDYDDYHKVQLLTEMSWDSEAWFIVSWKVFTDSTARLQFLRTHLRKYEVYNKVVARKKINPSQFCEGATMAACLENVATVAWSTVKWTRCFHHLP